MSRGEEVRVEQVEPVEPAEPDDLEDHIHLSGRHVLRDADDEDRWAWRRRVRRNPVTRKIYRSVIFAIGLVLVAGGLALVPLPGPGWLIVIAGIAVWASEFEKAKALLDFVRSKVKAWERWVKAQPRWVQAIVVFVTFAFVCSVLWVTFRLAGGLPTMLPDPWEHWGNETFYLT